VFIRVYRLKIQSVTLVFRPSFVNYCHSNLLSGSTRTPASPLFHVWISTLFTRTQCVRGGGVRVLGLIQVNTRRKVPFQVNFFRWHFALPSMSFIFLRWQLFWWTYSIHQRMFDIQICFCRLLTNPVVQCFQWLLFHLPLATPNNWTVIQNIRWRNFTIDSFIHSSFFPLKKICLFSCSVPSDNILQHFISPTGLSCEMRWTMLTLCTVRPRKELERTDKLARTRF
jgi:hypothetical protein